MSPLSTGHAQIILAAPGFKDLAGRRARLRWSLSIATLAMFFGFIVVISLAPHALSTPIAGGRVPVCMALALGMIVAVVALTGFYVRRANMEFDPLMRLLRDEFEP